MLKKLFITLSVLLFMGGQCVIAQQNTIFRAKAEGHYGWNLHDGGDLVGGEVGMELPLLGNHNWEYTYNFPSVGFAIGGRQFERPEFLRFSVDARTYFHFPVIHKNGFALNLKWGSGMGSYLSRGDSTESIVPVYGVWNLGLNMDIALSTRYGRPLSQWRICLGGNLDAFHNGNITRKSHNIYFADVFLGAKYTPNVWPLPLKYPARPVKHILALEAYGAALVNQLERDEDYFLNANICAGAYMPITNAYRLGLSTDAFYNGAYNGDQRESNVRYNFIDKDRFRNKLRGGVALANELRMDRVVVGLHTGVYFYSKIKIPKYNEHGAENENRIESILYNKLVTRFYFTPKFFLVTDLKTHLFRVECFQVGLGWAMPDFGSRIKNPFERISFKKEDKEELRID